MKYIAVLDTDDFEDFDFFEDGKEKYLHAIDATSDNGEWIYLPFRPLEQEPILDKITEIIEPLRHLSIDQMSDIEWQILRVIDKYNAETEVDNG